MSKKEQLFHLDRMGDLFGTDDLPYTSKRDLALYCKQYGELEFSDLEGKCPAGVEGFEPISNQDPKAVPSRDIPDSSGESEPLFSSERKQPGGLLQRHGNFR